jgi:glutamine cyclotransferase
VRFSYTAHDTKSFTEGLEFYKDTLYERFRKFSFRGLQILRKYDYKTGKVYKQIDLEDKYFGEGITLSMVNYIS